MRPSAGEAQGRTAADIVEALGFGWAQLRLLVMAHGVWAMEACQVSLQIVTSRQAATDLQWSSSASASLTSIIFIGIGVGGLLAGPLGDSCGRRPLVLASYAIATAAQVCTAAADTYSLMALLRLLLGIGHGLGMPTSLALVAEATPASSRKAMQGLRNVIFVFGSISGAAVVAVDSPDLTSLHWRWLLLLGAAPSLLLGLAAAMFLRESPVFLAAAQRVGEAEGVLAEMRGLNGQPGVDVTVRPPLRPIVGADAKARGWVSSRHFGIVFGRRRLFTTVALSMGCFVGNVVLWGHTYAFPMVAVQVHSSLPAAYQGLMQAVIGLGICFAAIAIASCTTYRSLLLIGQFVGTVGPMSFVWAGADMNKSAVKEAVFFVAQNCPGLCAACALFACFQLSTDLYPVEVSSTSASVVVVAGRLGAILGPLLFAVCGRWQSFYGLMASLSAAAAVMAAALLPPEAAQMEVQRAEEVEPLCAPPLDAKC